MGQAQNGKAFLESNYKHLPTIAQCELPLPGVYSLRLLLTDTSRCAIPNTWKVPGYCSHSCRSIRVCKTYLTQLLCSRVYHFFSLLTPQSGFQAQAMWDLVGHKARV